MMAFGEDIRALRDRVLADLNAIHDYYSDTKLAWRIVNQFVAEGKTITIKNPVTGTQTTEVELASKARGYMAQHLAEATFQQVVAIFEYFIFDLLRLWLLAHPQSLGQKTVDFRTVLDAADKESITSLVVDRELNEIKYEKPADWFHYLEVRMKLGCPSVDEIERIAETKASRDVLAHNRGIANKTYVSKAGKLARYKNGERIDISEQYHQETWELVRKVADDLSNAAIAKFP